GGGWMGARSRRAIEWWPLIVAHTAACTDQRDGRPRSYASDCGSCHSWPTRLSLLWRTTNNPHEKVSAGHPNETWGRTLDETILIVSRDPAERDQLARAARQL